MGKHGKSLFSKEKSLGKRGVFLRKTLVRYTHKLANNGVQMTKWENMAKLAAELMSKRENIRNIGTVAHIDHGKCIAPNTRILLADGNILSAEELYTESVLQGEKIIEDAEKTVFALKKPVKVFSVNKKTGKIEKKQISHAWKLKGGKTLKITLRNGLSAETTPEHKYLIFDGNWFGEKQAKELAPSDLVVCMQQDKNSSFSLQMTTACNTATVQKTRLEGLDFIQAKRIEESFQETVYDFSIPENQNFIAEGIVVHNTTLSDSLIAAAGLISQDVAGEAQIMDYEDQEQERGITINAANISLVFEYQGKKNLINLIDTPGHVDFTGEVIRAMRAVDGVIVVVDAVEGVMPQTETVIRQALKEYVKPVLFINKVDRLINELKVSEEEMQKRFVKVIAAVNNLIQKNVPQEFKQKWQVNPADGSVAFGSAKRKWAVSVPYLQKSGINFKQIYDYLQKEEQKKLSEVSPIFEVVLKMVIDHLPNPIEAQKYRTKNIWGGDLESELGKGMRNCDPNSEFAMMITDVSVNPHVGDIATGRVYSGTLKNGMTIKLIGMQKEVRIQKVGVFMGNDFVTVEKVGAGSVVALVGLKEVYAGETISTIETSPFESFKSAVEPVMTVSIEAKHTKDLPKLIQVLKQLTKEDPNLKASINQETGEHLLSGMGELHLDVNKYRIETTHKVPIVVGNPIVVYKETITKKSQTLEGISPNRHNKFKMRVEPILGETLQKLVESKIEAKIRPKDRELMLKLGECGFEKEISKKIWCVHNNNVLVDATRGIVALHEIKELVIQGFEDAMDQGPLAKEKCFGTMVSLTDATLHEDSIHRGPAQVLPAITRTIFAGMLSADAVLFEPKQLLTITVPNNYMGAVTKELGSKRTQISEIRTEGEITVIVAKAPVKELIGFTADMRGATQGRAVWTAEYAGYELLPRELQKGIVTEVRKRKGMEPEPKPWQFFLE